MFKASNFILLDIYELKLMLDFHPPVIYYIIKNNRIWFLDVILCMRGNRENRKIHVLFTVSGDMEHADINILYNRATYCVFMDWGYSGIHI